MKHKVCISIDESTLFKIKAAIRRGSFRNKSHAFEYAINRVMSDG